MHARRHAGPSASAPLPAHGRGRRWDGLVVLGLRLALLKSAGVTEFARVFQNRALRGRPNLMLSRMGGTEWLRRAANRSGTVLRK